MNFPATLRLTDCYKILKVSQDENWDTVKKSYRTLAKRYHPDIHPGNSNSEEKLKQITQAYQVLETRHKSNDGCITSIVVRESGPQTVSAAPENPREKVQDNMEKAPFSPFSAMRDKKKTLERLARGLGSALSNYERKIFLLDVHKEVRVHPSFAAKGGCLRIRQGRDSFEVKIPSGNWTRMSMKIPQRGESSLLGKKRGDLILNISVAGSNQVDAGDTLFFYDMNIAKENVAHIRILSLNSVDGPIKFILPRKTQDKQSFVLKSGKKYAGASHVVTVHLV